MPLAIVLILLVVGSLAFHFLSPWTFTPLASNWERIDRTVDITLVVTGLVFVAVNLFMAYCVIRFRHRRERKAAYEPENKRLEWVLTAFTTVGVAAMLAPGLLVWARFVDVPPDALQIEAVGQQWHWSYRLPGEDGRFGRTSTRLVSSDNPFGMYPEDPDGQDDVLVSSAEVHLPVNRPVRFWLRSKDVLHNFTVAQFRVKMDLVPGMETHMWLTPTRTGRFEVLCEELCGIAHHSMRGAVVVEEQEDLVRRSVLLRVFQGLLPDQFDLRVILENIQVFPHPAEFASLTHLSGAQLGFCVVQKRLDGHDTVTEVFYSALFDLPPFQLLGD